MSERFKVTKFEEPAGKAAGKAFKNYGATSAENDVELKGKLLPDSGKFALPNLKNYKVFYMKIIEMLCVFYLFVLT